MIHPLELHEIRSYIGSFLQPADLINCACVSQEWYSTFSDLIWRHITLQAKISALPSPGQIQAHSGLIHTLKLKNQLPNEYYLLGYLPRLYSIHVDYHLSCRTRPVLPFLGNLIETHSSTLKWFRLFGWNNNLSLNTYNAIGKCQSLNSLWLSNIMLTLEAVKALFGACSKIVQVAEGEEEDNVVTPKNSADGLRTLRLDDLSFRECTADILSDFAPLIHLQHIHIQGIHGLESEGQLRLLMLCPNIKSFYWRGILFKTKFQVDRWVEYIESGMWPQLTSLDVLGEEFHDEGLSRVIERLPLPLTKMLVKTTDFGPMAFHSLISISRHYTHLQELELFACSNVTSSMIQQVMVTMPALEHFSANRLCVTDIFGISSKHQSGISGYGGSWICKNLRILKLCIDMGVDSDPQALEYVEQQRQVHQRLSKLERLEVLEVSRDLPYREGIVKVRKLDHRLSTGLGHLSSLKRLRKFQFKPGQTLTMEEIEWMASTWEFLTTVSRNMNLDQKVNDELVKRLAKHNISVL